MLMNLLGFFEDTATDKPAGTPWYFYLIGGVFLIVIILMMVLPQRKQKKRQEEMMSKLGIGSIVTTIDGVVGEVVELDEKHFWLLTGTGDTKCTIQFLRQAILSIAPAPGSPEAEAEQKAAKNAEDEIDEIK